MDPSSDGTGVALREKRKRPKSPGSQEHHPIWSGLALPLVLVETAAC
jgi:hypothetical protein